MPVHAASTPARRRRRTLLGLAVVTALGLGGAYLLQAHGRRRGDDTATGVEGTPPPTIRRMTTTRPPRPSPTDDAPSSGFEREGLLTFRGSPTRTYYGEGPVPPDLEVLWSYPGTSGGMCAES